MFVLENFALKNYVAGEIKLLIYISNRDFNQCHRHSSRELRLYFVPQSIYNLQFELKKSKFQII